MQSDLIRQARTLLNDNDQGIGKRKRSDTDGRRDRLSGVNGKRVLLERDRRGPVDEAEASASVVERACRRVGGPRQKASRQEIGAAPITAK